MSKKSREEATGLTTETAFEGKELKFNDMVEFIGNGQGGLKNGTKYIIHAMHAETLVKKGYGEIGDKVEVEPRRVTVEKERKTSTR